MQNFFGLKPLSIAASLSFLLSGCFMYELGKVNFPPEEQTWIKTGWNDSQVDHVLIDCYRQATQQGDSLEARKLRADEVDICMLRKGFKPLPNPEPLHWIDPCRFNPQRAKCRAYRGELVIPQEEIIPTAPKPLTEEEQNEFRLREIFKGGIICYGRKPMRNIPNAAAYCECTDPVKPYEEYMKCKNLLLNLGSASGQPTESKTSITPSASPTDKLKNQVQKDSNIQMNQLQSSPAPLPTPTAASPVAVNPRLDQLKQFKSGR